MDYYKEIKEKIKNNEIYEKVKDYSKERHKVLTYFEIGRLLHEAGKHYGESVIKKYAISLEKEFGKKYDERTLRRMRQLFLIFGEPKRVSPKDDSSKTLNNTSNFNQKRVSPNLSLQNVSSPYIFI